MTQLNDEQRAFLMKYKMDLRKGKISKLAKDIVNLSAAERAPIVAYMIEHGVPILNEVNSLYPEFLYQVDIGSLVIPGNVTKVAPKGIDKCFMRDLVFEDGIQELREKAINMCDNLEKVVLPNSLNRLNSLTFNRCGNLKEVYIPDSIRVLPTNLFNRCSDDLVVIANFRESRETRLKCVDSERDWYRNHLKWIKGGE